MHKYMSKNNKTKEYSIMTISCKECKGTGFVKVSQEKYNKKKYCEVCNNDERCYLCQNVERLGAYIYCEKCCGDGYTEKKIYSKKSN